MSYLSLFLNIILGIGLLVLGYQLYQTTRKLKDLLKNFRQVNAEKKRMDSELQLASQIQLSMMPIGHQIQDHVEVCGSLVPAREMGGDLFDYYVRDEKLYFCIGDVCGKGAPAALFMAYAHSHIVGIVRNESNPARIVKALNEVASYDNVSCSFLTLLVGVLDLPTGRLQYCNAAHTPPFILGDDVKELACDPNQPVGPLGGVEFSLQEIMLTPGSTLFLYTDGLTEAKNAQGQEFGCERTKNALIDCRERQLNPKDIVNTVTEAVHQFTKNAEQSDDLTMLVVRYT